MSFSGMNDDCKMLILEELDFFSFLNMSEANHVSSVLFADVYRRKFGQTLIEVRERFLIDGFVGTESNDVIHIEDFDLAAKVILRFGPLITKLKISYWTNTNGQITNILKLANQHCTEVRELQLRTVENDVLNELKQPFANVDVALFRGILGKPFNKSLNELFPNVRNLSVIHMDAIGRENILQKFSHLEHLSVSTVKTIGINESDVQEMIKLNPQIRSLSHYYSTLGFLKFISENMPDLSDLVILWTHFSSEMQYDVHFKSVKRLNVTTESDDLPQSLTVDQLQELSVDWRYGPSSDSWISFITRHSNLTKLIIEQEINDQQLSRLIGKLPNLIEASFLLSEDTSPVTMGNFVESCQLQTLRLSCDADKEFPVSCLHHLNNHNRNKWNITNNSNRYLIENIVIN